MGGRTPTTVGGVGIDQVMRFPRCPGRTLLQVEPRSTSPGCRKPRGGLTSLKAGGFSERACGFQTKTHQIFHASKTGGKFNNLGWWMINDDYIRRIFIFTTWIDESYRVLFKSSLVTSELRVCFVFQSLATRYNAMTCNLIFIYSLQELLIFFYNCSAWSMLHKRH